MPITKVQNSLSGNNLGSSKEAVKYLSKENEIRDPILKKKELFFNQKGTFKPTEVVAKLDSMQQALGKKDGKFYSVTIAPSQKELAELSDANMKELAKNAMIEYAKNFNKGVNPDDLVWFAKLEHYRQELGYKEQREKSRLNRPKGKKQGELKEGDQRHLHIIVGRKSEAKMKLSPMATARKAERKERKGIDKNGKPYHIKSAIIGFDRVVFSVNVEKACYRLIRENNPNYKFRHSDTNAYKYLNKHKFHFEKAENLGINPYHLKNIKAIVKANSEKQRQEQVKIEQERQSQVKAEQQRQTELNIQQFKKSIKTHEITVVRKGKSYKFRNYNEDCTKLKVTDHNGKDLLIPNSDDPTIHLKNQKLAELSPLQENKLKEKKITSFRMKHEGNFITFVAKIENNKTVLKPLSEKQFLSLNKTQPPKQTNKKGRRL